MVYSAFARKGERIHARLTTIVEPSTRCTTTLVCGGTKSPSVWTWCRGFALNGHNAGGPQHGFGDAFFADKIRQRVRCDVAFPKALASSQTRIFARARFQATIATRR